jgi:hypothetical protein
LQAQLAHGSSHGLESGQMGGTSVRMLSAA